MKLKYITRIDSGNTHGWWVRIRTTKNKKTKQVQRFFADLSYQSKDWALLQAMIYLDEILEIRKETEDKPKRARYTLLESQGKRNHLVWYKRVSDGKWTCTSFSSAKYGDEEAKRLAKLTVNKLNRTLLDIPQKTVKRRTDAEKAYITSLIDLDKTNQEVHQELQKHGINMTLNAVSLFITRNGLKRTREQLNRMQNNGLDIHRKKVTQERIKRISSHIDPSKSLKEIRLDLKSHGIRLSKNEIKVFIEKHNLNPMELKK